MEITEVRIKLMEDASDRLRAFCSITFDDCFVVRDLKIIEGSNGPFVAMPSRKLTAHCSNCGCKNHLRAGHCNQCGQRLRENLAVKDADGRAKLYADIAHPINSTCREMIQKRVIFEYQEEVVRANSPDYTSRYDDYFSDAGEEGSGYEEVSPAAQVMEGKKIEPAEQQPRAPHTPQRQQTSENAAQPHAESEKGGFGKGIF